jgi:tetraacyldisaccharide 4'-kinase
MSRLHGLARRWWAGELGVAGTVLDAVLAPAEGAYRLGVALRGRGYGQGLLAVRAVPAPVVSVGNLAVGGTGKTPFAHWIALRLREQGMHPAVLHGGYAEDEPALHRQWSPDIPVVVGRDRVACGEQAIAAGADVLVLDDGFQHRRLARDLDIVLVAAERWRGTPRLLPRGPWREPLSALRRADIVVVTRKSAPAADADAVAADAQRVTGRPAVRAHLRPSGWRSPRDAAGEARGRDRETSGRSGGTAGRSDAAPTGPVLLVCGVAEPALFADNAVQAGADVAQVMAFPDHYTYTRDDAANIRAAAAGRVVVTTEKDWTKLSPLLAGIEVRLLLQEVVIESGADFLTARLSRLAQ